MTDSEDPARKIGARLAALQVFEELQKAFLDDFFGIVSREAEGEDIAQQGMPELAEKADDGLLFCELRVCG